MTAPARPASFGRKALAFLRRDYLIESSYPLAFITSNFNAFVVVSLFFFVGKLVNPAQAGLLRFGADYFSFTFVGYVFYLYFDQALGSFSRAIQREQSTGSFEAMLATQTEPAFCVLMSSFYYLLYAGAQLLLLLGVGAAFGVDFSGANLVSTLLVFLLSISAFASLGLISAASIIVLKKGDPLGWLLTTSNFLVGGAFFPIDVMPRWLQRLALFSPARYALEGMRLALLKGARVEQIGTQLLVLGAITAVAGPLSIASLLAALRKAQRDGSLVHH
jgi:ABC-2 type transport system permease protein